jgi:uncharacterized phage protein gp47/JayE
MVFQKKDFGEIFTAMRDRTLPTLTDFNEGSVVRTLFESFAYELAILYSQMEQVYLSAYVDTAEGTQLDMVVDILGIKRGEPDFATGMVTFVRDLGIQEDIVIPLGTIVTTEDTDTTPKKAYQTIEYQTIARDQRFVQVRVQAVHQGETETTDINTITVMPQPVPGVKSVTNEQRISFTGKQRETDSELRDRAKKSLIATSGANLTAIENALISLPGVKGVQVQENFHFARGKVTLTNADTQVIKISKGTKLTIGGKSFQITKNITFTDSQEVAVQALIAGTPGELTEPTTQWDTLEKYPNITITNQPIILQDFGILEVFVDGIDFNDQNKVSQLRQEIDRVRAAGIYVLLKPAKPIIVDGVFQIELVPGLQPSPEERDKLEQQIAQDIIAYIDEQKMGQPLLISQLTIKILAINGVNDVENFSIYTLDAEEYTDHSQDKRLQLDIHEKLTPRQIRVATNVKDLPVDVQITAAAEINAEQQQEIKQNIQNYFNKLSPGKSMNKSNITTEIPYIEITLIPDFLFWQPFTPFDGENLTPTIVEQIKLAKVIIELPPQTNE